MRADHPLLDHRRALEAAGSTGPWVALFDIDSTLMDTAPRNAAIFREALAAVPGLETWRSKLEFDGASWSVLEPLDRAGISDPHLRKAVHDFWKARFFTDEWLSRDLPYPGVADFLHDLKAEGFRVAYLTGRHSSGMERGTRRSFEAHGLPAGPEEPFFFKPSFDLGDWEFKASVCEAVAALGTLVVSVDNEPANVNLFHRRFPRALTVWVDTVTSPHPEEVLPGIHRATPRFFLDR